MSDTKRKMVTLTLDDHDYFAGIAAKEGITLNQYLNNVLEGYAEDLRDPPSPAAPERRSDRAPHTRRRI